jgi:hypothetical protein
MNAAPRERLAAGVIAKLPLFQQASRAHLDEVLRHAKTLYFRRGQVIARRGEPVPGLYAVAYGMVKLVLRADTGAERVLRLWARRRPSAKWCCSCSGPCRSRPWRWSTRAWCWCRPSRSSRSPSATRASGAA